MIRCFHVWCAVLKWFLFGQLVHKTLGCATGNGG